ncbi:MAG TPA: hypothetical protein VKH35_07075 [Thermoanaerobaculia bacterium]|nr:hypothetical protein [Thermoanaerobaculia bacterium]
MNLYLVFALALSAVSGTATTAAAATPVASVIAARAEHAAVCGAVPSAQASVEGLRPVVHPQPCAAAMAEVPLSGGASPRAPAAN